MKHGKLIKRQLYRDVFWMLYAIFQYIIGYNLDSMILMFIAAVFMGVNGIFLVMLIIDLVVKDDVRIAGTIVEAHSEIIVVETEKKKRREIVKKHMGISEALVEQQQVLIRETRRTGIVNGIGM